MAREPEIPGFTCPAIDSLQDSVSDAGQALTRATNAIDAAMDELRNMPRELEDLRKANDQLRQAAEYWKARAEDAEGEVRRLEREAA